ncbi:hypothetical protein ACFPK9_04615 [Rubritalea spongiae]|uniref:Uncharacterized protein n=1 Tax=Rubritalea spongiae TaxID=430797 RepID=A0ABW5E6K2_9BACT
MQTAPDYSITDLVHGWRFKVTETAKNLFKAEGLHLYGEKICIENSNNPNNALNACAQAARDYNAGSFLPNKSR